MYHRYPQKIIIDQLIVSIALISGVRAVVAHRIERSYDGT